MWAKKSLGQNFLTSEAAVYKTVAAARIFPGEIVLEVGPGRGVLTKALLAAGATVIAVEKDSRLISELSTTFKGEIESGQLVLFEKDILKSKPETLGLQKQNYKIVANIPYYITGQFLKKFLTSAHYPNTIVVLLQKEVVERIIALDKKESILSISVKAYGKPNKVTVVKRGSFSPAPNVDSAVIAIENISKDLFENISEEKFFRVVRAGFAHKRKVLISNLTEISPREKVQEIFSKLGLNEKIRAEDLKIEEWKKIATVIV